MAMERKKTNQICTVEEFGKFKSIHGRFERSTSLSGYEKIKLVEDLRSVWPRLVEVGDEMGLCFDDHKQEPDSEGRVPYPVLPRALILEKLILGDEMPFFFKSLVKSVSEFFKASPLDVDLNLLRVKNTVRDFHLVMIRLREQFGEEVEARYGIGKRYVRFYNLPGHFQIETLPRSDTQQSSQAAQTQTKEQPWVKDSPEYIPASEAVKLVDRNLSLPQLSKLLRPDGAVRYMRRGQRCKVHVNDFRNYVKSLRTDMFSEEEMVAIYQ